jgi:putative transposase
MFAVSRMSYTPTTAATSLPATWSRSAPISIRLILSMQGKPNGRGRVERFFSTLDDMFLCELDGYAQTGKVRGKPTLSLAELESRFRTFSWTCTIGVTAPRRNATGRTQGSEWIFAGHARVAGTTGFAAIAGGKRAAESVAMTFTFTGFAIFSPTLVAYVGEPVTVRCNPRDLGEIRVFHKEGFLCRAVSTELARESVPLREILRARDGRRHELRAVLKDRPQAVEPPA